MNAPGRLVILNGVSSAGKTTLATAFRDERARLGDYWMLIGIDDVLSKLPIQWLDLGLADGRGVHSRDGLWFDDTEGGLRLRVGALGRRLLHVYHQWVSDAVRTGMNVIVDDVVLDRDTYDDWCEVLAGLEPTWVAVRCAPEIAEARERERGDRPVGMASTQHDVVHAHVDHAVEIDTGERSPSDALATLRRGLDLPSESAYDRPVPRWSDVDDARRDVRAALTAAMRQGDRHTTAALRSFLGALDNAEAADANAAPPIQDGVIAGGVAGLGAGDVARRTLSADEIDAVLRAEIDERRAWPLDDGTRAEIAALEALR